jgi:PhnB protein
MPNRTRFEQLDQAVQEMLARPGKKPRVDPSLTPLLRIAEDLCHLPRAGFKVRLKKEILRRSSMPSAADPTVATTTSMAIYLAFHNAAAAIDFYKRAFGAEEKMRLADAGGKIGHAEIRIAGSTIMLSDEFPNYGAVSPKTLGGSPAKIHLYVPDVDAFTRRAVSAGAMVVRPIEDQFYGDRSGQVADPFGYTWIVSTRTQDMSEQEIQRRFDEMAATERKSKRANPIREGFHTLTPYIVVQDASGLIDFVSQVFGAEQTFRSTGSAGGVHAEVRIGDSMMMIGGGSSELSWRGDSQPTALHIYVEDTDGTYQRALAAGGISISPPMDQPYGERGASVKDRFGNHWYIATAKGTHFQPEGLGTVTPYLHPLRAEPFIRFLERAFGAAELEKYASPDGVVQHAKVRLGDSALEMGEAHGPYSLMPTMFYLYVPDADATYQQALAAGATSLSAPADQPYGDRNGAVKDPFGNSWYVATHLGRPSP